jgi:glutaredoxin 3
MEYLSQKGVPYTEKNVGKDPAARQELASMGVMSLPVILIGDKRLTGFNPKQIDAALAEAG